MSTFCGELPPRISLKLSSRYLSELIVAANETKLLKKQQRDAVIAEEVRQFEMQQLLGQSSPGRLRDLMDKAKAQIVAEVTM